MKDEENEVIDEKKFEFAKNQKKGKNGILLINIIVILIVLGLIAFIYKEYINEKVNGIIYENEDDVFGFLDGNMYEEDDVLDYDLDYDYDEDDYYEIYDDLTEEELATQKALFEVQKQNIKVDRVINYGRDFIVVTNNNDEMISDLEVFVFYYDETRNIIDVYENYIGEIYANGKSFFDLGEIDEEYATIEFFVKKFDYDIYNLIDYGKEIDITTEEDKDEIIINFKNNSDENIGWIEYVVCYYDENNTLVYAQNFYIDMEEEDDLIKPGKIYKDLVAKYEEDFSSYDIAVTYVCAY